MDYLLRVSPDELDGIAMAHLCTADDPAVLADCGLQGLPGVRGGITEWSGSLGGHAVSLSWDWLQLADGSIQAVTAIAPRTNLRLLDSKGYDCEGAAEAALLWSWIARLRWSASVLDELRAQAWPALGTWPPSRQQH